VKLVVGLGNPGLKYKNTRHNLGFKVVDTLAGEWDIKISKKYCQSVLGTGRIEGNSVALVKPLTFMNNSGQAVKGLLNYYKINPQDLIVVCDDFSLEVERIRIRKNGSSGGHNGLKSIIGEIGTNDFIRVRIGIGQPSLDQDPAVYVLKDFARSERNVVKETIDLAGKAVKSIIVDGIESAMNKYNKKDSSKSS
jgi:peptidyl-tRNA hydrolase, PTH1 family